MSQPDRSTYFGSSDIAPILGISPFRTPLDVYLDKTVGRQPVTAEKKKIFARGHRLEPYILDIYSEDTGAILVRRNERYTDPVYPFMAAEVDAETEDGKNVEAKSTHQFAAKSWGEQMTDAIPIYYNAQAQFAMGRNGAMATDFPVLIGIDDFRIYNVKRDEETIALLTEAANDFWVNHILAGVAPAPTTVSDLDRLFPWDHGSVCQATEQIRDAVADLKNLKKKIKLMEADETAIAAQIKLYMGEHSVLQYGATPLLTWKSQSAKLFDGARFKADHAKIAAKYTKESVSRVMRLK